MKVKDGLEKFMSSNTSASRRYLDDSKNMLDDSKAKIALLRMQIEKIAHQEHDIISSSGDGTTGPDECVPLWILRNYRM
ncbi:hypothetical protein OESDEN_04596 [Oesophagostomum dentatum]|uniref:REM-1 domain-containing protein n=1 Tax=Oesophagostomum dentatum TaxID=61180 RepID=A0A0B1TDX0_OESDE|nr:hypothetical protein OESDEN_04596 [Oesophagostomum dentatum]